MANIPYNRITPFVLPLLLGLFLVMSLFFADEGRTETRRILYLNSYHPGYRWSDEIGKSLDESLAASNEAVEISVEYLDSLRFPGPVQQQRVASMLAAKYASYRHDLIIASDNAALDFVVSHRSSLFPSLPVVFCGYNDFHPSALKGVTNVTGINETIDVAGLVDLALPIHPGTHTLVFVLSTREISNRLNAAVVETIVVPRYRGRYNLVVLKDASIAKIRATFSRLMHDSLVFQIGWTSDTDQGRALTPLENGRLISAASPVPVYTLWDFCLGSGVLGGHVLTGGDQGRAAAEMALRILGGESADRIPVMMSPPASNIFDYSVMKRFSVADSALPVSSRVINRPGTVWRQYRRQILGASLLLAVESALIAALLLVMRQRRHALRALERERTGLERRVAERTRELYEERLRLEESLLTRDTMLDNALVTISLVRNRRIVWISNHVAEMFGYTADEMIGRTTEFLHNDPGSYHEICTDGDTVLSKGETFRGDYCYRRKDGSTFWCSISGKALDPFDFNRGILFVVLDIDDRKRIERALQEANTRLGLLATTDALTGIANRLHLTQGIEHEIVRHNRYNHPFSVILMDVDYFKAFNDQFGHDAGDSVLRQIAGILKQYSRGTDMSGRWGGEEFLVVCPETDLDRAGCLAELFRLRIAQHDFNLPIRVTASFGVEQYRRGVTVENLLKGADNALYQAKRDSRNCVRLSDAQV